MSEPKNAVVSYVIYVKKRSKRCSLKPGFSIHRIKKNEWEVRVHDEPYSLHLTFKQALEEALRDDCKK